MRFDIDNRTDDIPGGDDKPLRTAQLAALYDAMPGCHAFFDRKLRFVSVSKRFASMFGRPAPDFVGRRLREALPETADQVEPLIRQVIRSGIGIDEILVAGKSRKSGRKRQWLASFHAVRSEDAPVHGAIVSLVEITELRPSGKSGLGHLVRPGEAEHLLALAIESGRLGICIWDISDGTRSWSDASRAQFGLPADIDITEHVLIERIHPDDLAKRETALRRCIVHGEPYRVDLRFTGQDGSVDWARFRGQTVRDAAGHAVRLLAVVERIGDKIESDKAASWLAAVVNSSGDAIIGMTLDGTITSWNEAAESIFGYVATESVGKSISIIAGPGSGDDGTEILSRIARGEKVKNYETRRNRKDGRSTDVSINASAVRDSSGAIVGASKIVRDISDENRAKTERLRLARRVISVQEQERSRLARELHDGVGQEMIAMSFALKRLEPAVHSEDARRLLDSLQASMKKLSADLHATLWELYSPALTELGLCRAIEDHLIDWSALFGLPHEFRCNRSDRAVKLVAETEWAVYRVVQEALTNVLKHANAASVTVSVEITLHTLRVTVVDDGKGFNPAGIEPTSSNSLGIRGMHERLGLVGGAMRIDSIQGRGTTLFIEIPLHESIAAVA
jgi:PAS domain S-box-containing protein